MSLNVSKKQLNVLKTLKTLSESNGYMPSVRELATALDLSPATTQQHLNALRKKGLIRSDGTAHGIRLIDPSAAPAPARGPGRPRKSQVVAPSDDAGEIQSLTIPIVGKIAAGRPIEAIENHQSTFSLPVGMARSGDYILRIEGESMIEDGIFDGDYVLIRPQERVENGQIAAALLEDGTATLKRIYAERDHIRLQPANRDMAPMYVTRLRIQGRVVGLVRLYN